MLLPPNGEIDVEFGNASEANTEGTGWFIGFSQWASGLRHMPAQAHASGLCVKWFAHPSGHPNGEPKPLSEGRTISILVGPDSEFRIDCSHDERFSPQKTVSHTLRKTGDYALWGTGIYHRAYGIQPATILTIRWQPV